jgi:hypothetical protein
LCFEGEVLATRLIFLMKESGMPNGLSGVGYTKEDIPALVEGAWPQKRVIDNAPLPGLSVFFECNIDWFFQ